MQKLIFIFFIIISNAGAQFNFNDSKNKTTESSQAIYEDGGENTKYRLTETEKALDQVKKQLASFKQEIELLKKQVSELSNKNTVITTIPLNEKSSTPTPRPTVY